MAVNPSADERVGFANQTNREQLAVHLEPVRAELAPAGFFARGVLARDRRERAIGGERCDHGGEARILGSLGLHAPMIVSTGAMR
ncbi:MAG TPA: hypothetical protein VFF06_14830 [Polyangia bacterium]|nr:hypothetical protein [Polyangia bacterium]